jgi:hypothetical protein
VVTTEISPHLAFNLYILASLFCAAKATQSGSRTHWHLALIAAGLAFATLEVTFVLVAVLLWIGWRERNKLGLNRAGALRSLGVFLAAAVVAWPAGILKLAAIKSYLFMAYLAVARQSAWGQTGFIETWVIRFTQSPVEWLLIGITVAVWLASPQRRTAQALPFLLFGALMTLVMLRIKTSSLRYALPFLPALHVFAGITLGAMLARQAPAWRWAGSAACVLLLAANLFRYDAQHPPVPDQNTRAILDAVNEQELHGKHLLVPQDHLPSLHYYFPDLQLKGYTQAEPDQTAGYDAVLLPGQTRFVVHP